MDLRAELCKTCIHTKVCMKDKNVFGDNFVGGNPMYTDNAELYKKYEIRKAAGFPCDDYVRDTHWIPVTERLPEQGQVVLVWTEWEEYRVFKRDDGDMEDEYKERYFWEEQSSECLPYQRTCVIAWMPLPVPFRGES